MAATLGAAGPTRATCGVLPVSLFRDARALYVMRRLGEATDEFFDALRAEMRRALPEAAEEERRSRMLEGLARTVPGWSAPVVNQRVQRLLELARDFEHSLHATFALYVKDTHGQDIYGRQRKVQVCMPSVGAFLHMYFMRIVAAPEVKRGGYFDPSSTLARNFAVSNAMLDALADISTDHVRVGGPREPSAAAAPASAARRARFGWNGTAPAQPANDYQTSRGLRPSSPASSDSFEPTADSDDAGSDAGGSRDGAWPRPQPPHDVPAPAAATAQQPSAAHPFDAVLGATRSGAPSSLQAPSTARFHTFVPPKTVPATAAAATPKPPSTENAAAPFNPGQQPAPALAPAPREVPSSAEVQERPRTSASRMPPPPPRTRPRTSSRQKRSATSSSTEGALALIRKLQGGD